MLLKLRKLISEYDAIYETAWNTGDFKHPIASMVRNDIADDFRKISYLDTNKYLVKASCGTGKFTAVPWIAVFDKRITKKASEGVYIVYLINKDAKELYLTLNQAATGSSISELKSKTDIIRNELNFQEFDDDIVSGSEAYDAGCILAKKYTLSDLNDKDSFLNDLKIFVQLYDRYVNWYLKGNIKKDFFKFLGSIDSLIGYQKSYKLVLYKVMLELMDEDGRCDSIAVANSFKQYYVDRVNAGKVADVDVDRRIEFIKESSAKDVYNVIITNPFRVISDKGFMFKTNEKFEQEKICFDEKLMEQLSDDDLTEIKTIVEQKLELYYSEIDQPQKTWLLVWNPNNWNWEDFAEAVELVSNGEDYEMSWSCSSKQVNPGDRVFLSVSGLGESNGIIASGFAMSETYESGHWDGAKRERGQTSNHIDVRFDCIRDFKNETYLLTSKLKKSFPEQQWSPMSSGISIKEYYCEELEKVWKHVIDSGKLSFQECFILWMKWQPQRKSPSLLYKQGTIDSMVSILRRGSSAFDSTDSSIANCFEINDADIFREFAQKVYTKATQLDKKYGHSDYRNALNFYYEFLKVQSIKGIDYSKIEAIIDSYEKNFDVIFEGEKYKIDALETFNKYWDINASDFSGMLEKAFSKCANLLTSGNYFAYKTLVKFAEANPEIARTLFKRLYDVPEDFVKVVDEFKSQSAAYFDSLGKSTYQDLHAVSVYAFFIYPHKYCIYKSSFYDDFANIIGFNPEKVKGEYNNSRIKNNETLFEAVKYVLSTHSVGLLERFKEKNQECNLDSISLNYWVFDVINSIRYGFVDLNDWWPSLEEYNPKLTKDDWKKYILEIEMPNHPSPMQMLKAMVELGGVASCKQLAQKFGGTPSYYVGCTMNLGRRIKKYFNLPACMDGTQERFFPFPFLGRGIDDKDGHQYMYKIRPELHEALKEVDLTDINSYYEEGEKMTTKQKIEAIKNYIAAKGFNYEGDLIENFYLSLKSKPFVILAGTSGTGKTRLVKLFAEAIGAEDRMKLVPVRPDWSDSSDLFGHTDLSGKFQPGAIIDFIKQAEWNKDKPFFLCLDEMNLARVEYYLSDFLSIIETRDRKDNGDIETDSMVDVDYYKDVKAAVKYGRVFIPENLYIVGTVNMDETTFPFSKKVLDRANTIEFSYVNLMSKPSETYAEPVALNENNSFLKTEYLYLRDCDNTDVVNSVCFDLEELNSILVKANLHVGYRVRDEISFYMMNNKNADLLSAEAAFDNEIMQKILPRIQGSSRVIKDVLSEMFVKCAGDYTGLAGTTDFEQMQSYIDAAKECKYPNSAKKIAFMMRRYEEDGFTSYWL